MSIKIISRGKGKSAVAAAAYRSGEKITNEYDGITHDYTRKGGIAHTEILRPTMRRKNILTVPPYGTQLKKLRKTKIPSYHGR